jgi:hypothetical protein
MDDIFAADELREAYGEKQKQRQAQRDADLREIMGTVQGRRFIFELMDRAGLWRTSFMETNEMAFREGMRNVALMLWGDLQRACPESILKMQEEARGG